MNMYNPRLAMTELLSYSPSFEPVTRVDMRSQTEESLISLIEEILVIKQLPLVIENFMEGSKWDNYEMFTLEWLQKTHGTDEIYPRDVEGRIDYHQKLSEYISHVRLPFEQKNPRFLYGKDISCPPEWRKYCQEKIPDFLWYKGTNDATSNLPQYMQPDNLMIYIGYQGTQTPGHKDICGSLGHNLLINCEEGASAFWFMMHSEKKNVISKWWKKASKNQGNINLDNWFAPPEILAQAPFRTYIIEQKKGDFVLVPSDMPHQVVNQGGYSIKISWNRMIPKLFSNCITSVLPNYRKYKKPEIYRTRALIYFTVKHYFDLTKCEYVKPLSYINEMYHSLIAFEEILREEWIQQPVTAKIAIVCCKDIEPHLRICDYCRADIWNRAYHCNTCTTAYGMDGFDLCLSCFARGRSCGHSQNFMSLMEHIPIKDLIKLFDEATEAYNHIVDNNDVKMGVLKSNLMERLNDHSPKYYFDSTVGYNTVFQDYASLPEEFLTRVCHHCRKHKNPQEMIQCRNHRLDVVRRYAPPVAFCSSCLQDIYNQDIYDLRRQPEWQCKICTNECLCFMCAQSAERLKRKLQYQNCEKTRCKNKRA